MPALNRHRAVPEGRIDLAGFESITGISHSTFYRTYRWEPYYIELWDLREYLGKLTLDESKVRAWVKQRLGPLANRYLTTFPTSACPNCGAANPIRRANCVTCGASMTGGATP